MFLAGAGTSNHRAQGVCKWWTQSMLWLFLSCHRSPKVLSMLGSCYPHTWVLNHPPLTAQPSPQLLRPLHLLLEHSPAGATPRGPGCPHHLQIQVASLVWVRTCCVHPKFLAAYLARTTQTPWCTLNLCPAVALTSTPACGRRPHPPLRTCPGCCPKAASMAFPWGCV